MDYQKKKLQGKRRRYTMGAPVTDGTGGEGTVYSVAGHPGLVAKIYHEDILRQHRDFLNRKLNSMLKHRVEPRIGGRLRIAWPVDILTDHGSMVGYVMPRVRTHFKIYDVWREGSQDKVFARYTWKKSVKVALSMAELVRYLHDRGVVLGDMNQKNFMVDRRGNVILVDTDSLDIHDPDTREHYPCRVALPEVLAPELQTVGNLAGAGVRFTREGDHFSLAVQIFRLLFNGFHPFGCVTTNHTVSSSSLVTEQAEIVNGNCAYVRSVPGRAVPPLSAPMSFLPQYIQNLFDRAFNYTATTAKAKMQTRPVAKEWENALRKLSRDGLRTCSGNYRHRFPGHNKTCPFCGKKPKSLLKPFLLLCVLAVLGLWIEKQGGLPNAWEQLSTMVSDTYEAARSYVASLETDKAPELLPPTVEAPPPETAPADYVLPSHLRPLTEEDVAGLTWDELQMGINEIYARHGRYFSTPEIYDTFAQWDWYAPDGSLSDEEIVSSFTQVERENLQFLVEHRNAADS